jgi:hypothetical protein
MPTERMINSVKIVDVTKQGHSGNPDTYVQCEGGTNGWLILRDSPQDLRIYATCSAIWAAARSGKAFKAKLFYRRHVCEGGHCWFEGVERIEIEA